MPRKRKLPMWFCQRLYDLIEEGRVIVNKVKSLGGPTNNSKLNYFSDNILYLLFCSRLLQAMHICIVTRYQWRIYFSSLRQMKPRGPLALGIMGIHLRCTF